ncbi:hypothetical protein V9T40_006152 [Parthenolecanium corni]|uniref:Uncharacterized protein n=1 Tax=Parthenolecanium corni TaxID=536013 RepID=A0AAN9TXH0_9HEMI
MMDRHPNKRLRLSGSTKTPFNEPYHSSVSTNKYSTTDDDELWGGDLAVDDDLIQEIETQGYSQYQSNVKNLRLELGNKEKQYRAHLNEKDAIIDDLKKQLTGKQSEIDFQKIEKLSQSCKTPKSTSPKTPNTFRRPQNLNYSFHERKLSDSEKGIHIRQTITMLAKIVQIEPLVASMIIESDRTPVSNCPCNVSEKVLSMSSLFNSSLRLNSPKSPKPSTSRRDEKMDIDEHCEVDSSKKKSFVFDVVELAHDIIQEVTVREKSYKYEGVFSSILYLYSILCNGDVNLYEKHSLTSTSHNVQWLCNKSDSRFCECLLMLEQLTVDVMLCCVDLHNSSEVPAERSQTKSLLSRCDCIFQQFRWQDTDFDLHISTCRGDYRKLLQFICDIVDDEFTKKFVTQELESTSISQKYELASDTRHKFINSMLYVFTEDRL